MSKKFDSLLIRTSVILESLAREKKTMYYHELAKALGGHSPRSIWIATALGRCVEVDLAAGNPPKSILIVRNDTNRPGYGFWWKLEELGAISNKDSTLECQQFYQQAMTRLGIPPKTAA